MDECGDCVSMMESGNTVYIALLDVLGHGKKAREVAILAQGYIARSYPNALLDMMQGLHQCLHGTRGAVGVLCEIDRLTGRAVLTGVGNVTARIFGRRNYRFVFGDGIIGYGEIHPVLQETELGKGDVFVLHSDGIREHFDELECIGLFKESAKVIAGGLVDRFGRESDDASCLVYKQQ